MHPVFKSVPQKAILSLYFAEIEKEILCAAGKQREANRPFFQKLHTPTERIAYLQTMLQKSLGISLQNLRLAGSR